MTSTREQIEADVLHLLRELADDWDYSGEITGETRLIGDMGLESLDVVVLSTAIQEHYGQVLPFNTLFAEVGQREHPDISVGEWVDFTHRHLNNHAS